MNNMFHSIFRYRIVLAFCAAFILAGLEGCSPLLMAPQMLVKMRENFEKDYSSEGKKVELLKPIPKSRESIHLEIFLVEKPLFDPLMGNKLWNEVDQIAGLDIAVREKLNKNGFKIGRVSSRPPVALQSLLGLTSDINGSNHSYSKGLNGREIFVLPGSETILMTGATKSECQFRVESGSGKEVEEFKNANCVFRVQADRKQDGFANLKFIPEIRYGDNRYRHLATDEKWVGRTSQEIAPFFHQQFELNLNIGEMAIISADSDKVGTIGNTFFASYEDDQIPTQRILVVRLAEMKNIVPLYPEK